MSRLRVWAPRARRVEAVLDGARVPLAPLGEGSFELERSLEPEAEYAVSLDGGPPLPDPRAPRLPHGVEGPARLVDHARFRWSDAGFEPPPLAAGLVYELHVGTFSPEGTFDGAAARLDALVELGVTHVELMPVNSFAGTHGWGYDGVGLFAPHEPYGGPDGLKRLVDAAHARGLAVLLDVVYNHFGPCGNHLLRFGPYTHERHHTPWGEATNLDGPGSVEVRRFFCDNALAWLRDYHFDGLRIDAVHALCDDSEPHFLAQLRAEVDTLAEKSGRRLVLVAESDLNEPRVVRPLAEGGYGMDAQWSDDFHHALHALLTGERQGYYADFGRLADLAKAIESAWVYDGRFSPHRGRPHGRPPDGLPPQRFLAYLQNHDQIGNRARGERSSHLLDPRALRVAAGLVLLLPFVPMLFQGEEWGASAPFLYFTSHPDPELGRAVRDGRRREFASHGWRPEEIPDPQDPDTFARSRLDWSERAREPHAGLFAWHRRLIALRRARPELRDGSSERPRVRFDDAAGWLVASRGRHALACNFGAQACALPLAGAAPDRLVLASEPDVRVEGGAVRLPAMSLALLEA